MTFKWNKFSLITNSSYRIYLLFSFHHGLYNLTSIDDASSQRVNCSVNCFVLFSQREEERDWLQIESRVFGFCRMKTDLRKLMHREEKQLKERFKDRNKMQHSIPDWILERQKNISGKNDEIRIRSMAIP